MIEQNIYNIGYVKNTHGLKGFFEIKLVGNKINLLKFIMKNIFIFDNNMNIYKPFTIEKVILKNNNFVIKLENINDINCIKKFVKHKLFLSIKDIHSLNENIEKNIIGYTVIDVSNDEVIGKVIELNTITINKILSFKNPDNKIIMVPFIDEFIIKIDDMKKNIYVKLIDGMA